MSPLSIAAALLAALVAQTTLVSVFPGGDRAVDLVLVVVLLTATGRGPAAGLWTGTVGGLLQDALSGGVLGVGGLTKTVAGVVAGAGMQSILGTGWRRLAVVFAASVGNTLFYAGVYALVNVQGPAATATLVVGQALVNTSVAALVMGGAQAWPGLVDRVRRRRQAGRHGWKAA